VNASSIDIIEGFDEVITVNVAPVNATGIVLVEIGGRGYYANLTGGVAKVVISGLVAGDYTAIVKYAGDKCYNESTTTTSFKVGDKINVVVNGTGNTTVVITVPGNNTNGTVTIVINGTNYTGEVINGTAVINLTNVTPGDHNATIIYVDGNNNTFEYNTTISVPKWASSVNASSIDIIEGFDEVITVNVSPVNATGIVLVEIGGRGYYANVSDGVAKVVISGLKAGNYTAVVKYSGDKCYNESTTTTSFRVGDKINVVVNGTGNSSVVIITVPGNNTNGTVTIVINGTNYTGEVINGTAIVNLTNVTPGDHNATIIYNDGNNNTSEFDTIITIPKWDAVINAAGIDIIEGFDEVITVVVSPVNATGRVVVDIDGKGYYANVTDGVAKVVVSGLKAGNYTAAVTYLGNDYYNEAVTTAKFTVAAKITIEVNGTGNSSVVIVTVPGNNTNGTVTIIINGTNYTGNVTNGTAIINLTNVTPGDHNATIIYNDGNNNTSELDTTITIPKWDSSVFANSTNIREGDVEVITIAVAPVNATGIVLVDIAGKGYYANITGGKATLEVENLKVGDYTAFATYLGDRYYNNSTVQTSFKVSEKINVTTNITGNGTDLVINLPGNATGNITVIIDNQTYILNITNGTVILPLDNLTPGVHNVTIIYVDENGTESIVNKPITVAQYETPISIEVENTMVGDTTRVTVTVPDGVQGYIQLDIDGLTYYEDVVDGKAVFEITGLLAGSKTVTATYPGDDTYAFNSEVYQFEVTKHNAPISVKVDSSTPSIAIVSVDLPDDATGYVIVNVEGTDYGINLTNGETSATVPIKVSGVFTADVTYLGDYKYLSNSTAVRFHATGPSHDSVSVDVHDTPVNQDVVVRVTVPEGETGDAIISLDGRVVTVRDVTGGDNYISIPNGGEGNHTVSVTYTSDDGQTSKTITKDIAVFASIIAEDSMTRGWNSPYDYKAEFLDNEGHVLADTDVVFTVNGNQYVVKTDEQGIAYLDADLPVGKYDIGIYNPVTGESVTKKTTIVKRIINNKDLTMDFRDGTRYVVRVIGDDGKPVGAGEVVGFHVNGVDYNGITDSNGYARLIIRLNPNKYTITAQYRAYKVSNKIVVKQTLKLVKKTIKVKKSAKSFKIKATLKWTNGKAIKGKKITIKFYGKSYKVKTNKKGVAQVTIKKSYIKKLKKGKKYKFYAKYYTNYAKGIVKLAK
jgi:hypothetical protein